MRLNEEESRPRALTKPFPYGGYGDLYESEKKSNQVGKNLFLFDNELFFTYSRDSEGNPVFPNQAGTCRTNDAKPGFDDGLLTSGLESGLKYVFQTLYDIGTSEASTEQKMQQLAVQCTPDKLQKVLSNCKNEEMAERAVVLHYDERC